MKFDVLLNHIGSLGKYQRLMILWIYLGASMDGYHYGISVFILPTKQHRCALPNLPNDTYKSQGNYHDTLVNQTIPYEFKDDQYVYEKCHIYNASLGENGTKTECNSWVYDHSVFSTSVIEDMNLVCDRSLMSANCIVVFFFGVLIGVVTLGNVSDIVGRRTVMMYSILLQGSAALGSAWVNNIYLFYLLRFLTGIGCSGSYIPTFILATEIVGLKYRTFVAIIEQAFFTVGLLVLCGLAYLLDDWRLLTTVISIPSFIFAATYFLFIPESPRWLISSGRLEEADKIIKRIARINNKEIPVEYFSEISAEMTPKVKFWKVFTSKKLTCWCAIMCFCWISVSVVYFGLALNSQDLGGNVFVNFSLGAMVEFPAYFFCIIFLDRMGRKKLQSLTMVVGGVSCLATVLPILLGNSSYQWLVLLFAMIGKLGITSAFGAVYLFGCELFPTVLRNSAMGLFSTCGRIGAVVAPYIAELVSLVPITVASVQKQLNLQYILLVNHILSD
ncbi:organic cation transporter protein-like [Octopus sinensis]|uniref:Organic cation transporter protein-like n=1 Tax=Octopus sinensis TaxID=2607531 RepID=A0A6P7TZE6_9MOLL|nr:organic cation transporter protein-like [Octopus sinensis]